MEFRRLCYSDLESFYACRIKALKLDPHSFMTTAEAEEAIGPQKFAPLLAHEGKDRLVFGAVVNGQVVGTTGLVHQESWQKTQHKALIWGMFVDPAHRGEGIGKRLLQLAIDHAFQEMKVDIVQLSVESSNHTAKALYRSVGFKTWGVEPKAMRFQGRDFDEDHMYLMR